MEPGTKRKHGWIGWAIAGVLLVTTAGGAYVASQVRSATRDAYAGWHAGGMIIFHMRANGNRMPRDWEELRDDHAAHYAGSGGSFEEIRERVAIDFAIDPAALADPTAALPEVVRLRSGSEAYRAWTDPNRLVREHLGGKIHALAELNAR